MVISLSAAKRDTVGKKVAELRAGGRIPAVVYGAGIDGADAIPVELSAKDFEKALKEAGESTVIALSIDGDEKQVLIHDIDRDPVSYEPRHADFYAIKKGQKVEVSVPLQFEGIAPAIKELGANIIKVMHEIDIEAEAANLPHEILVDISNLTEMDQQILAKDIALPQGVSLITKPEEVVVTVAAAEEEPEEPVAGPDMDAIEISEDRGKKEEEASAAEEKKEGE